MRATVLSLLACMCVSWTASAAPPASLPYQRGLTRAARAVWGLEAPVPAMAAQIEQESAWSATAQSAYAQGLAQFTPSTAAWISGAYPSSLKANQPFNPAWALRALVQYDFWLAARAGAADECHGWAMLLSAYNGGLGWLNRDKNLCAAETSCNERLWFGNVELYTARSAAAMRENRAYPRRILLTNQAHYDDWGRTIRCSVYPAYRPS